MQENCWFFCSVIQQWLEEKRWGRFMNGELPSRELGKTTRQRILQLARANETSGLRSLFSSDEVLELDRAAQVCEYTTQA